MSLKNVSDLKSVVMSLFSSSHYSAAYKLLVENHALVLTSPELLVLKGKIINSSDEFLGDGIKESVGLFKLALSMDPGNIAATLELGFCALNVEDNPEQAIQYFQRVRCMNVDKSNGFQALIGEVDCLLELGDSSLALSLVRQSSYLDADEKVVMVDVIKNADGVIVWGLFFNNF